MKVLKIEAKQVYSWEDIDITFNKDVKTHLFTGKNGRGKTSLLSCIVVALFGRPLEGSLKDVVREGETHASVAVTLYDDSSIYRISRKFSSTGSHSAEVEYRTRGATKLWYVKGVSPVKDFVKKHFGVTYEIFIHTVFFSQSMTQRFLDSTDAFQKTLLEQIFGNSDLDGIRKSLENKLSQVSAKKIKCSSTVSAVKEKLSLAQSLKMKSTKELKTLIKSWTQKRVKYQQTHEDYSNQTAKLNKELKGLRDKRYDSQNELGDLESSIRLLSGDKCSVCQSSLTDKRAKTLLKAVRVQVDEVRSLLMQVNKNITKIQPRYDHAVELRDKASNNILEANKKILEMKSDLNTLTTLDMTDLGKLEETVTEMKGKVRKLAKTQQFLEVWKKAFGKRGFVAFMLQRSLPFIDERANYYIQQLVPASITLQIDPESGRLKYDIQSDIIKKLKSSGQSRVLDFAVCLALHDVIEKVMGAKIQFLVLDEAPEHLDEELSAKMATVISELKYAQVFAITHDQSWSQYFDKVYHVTRGISGKSKLKEL